MKKIIKLAITDFKLIFRDSALRIFLVLPLIIFGLFLWFLPYMIGKYEIIQPYLSIFLMVGIIENTQMFSFISSMVLIDEKETEVAKTYGVIPLSKVQYVISKLLIPFSITVLLNVVLIEIQVFYQIGWLENLTISILTALVVPVYVLGINSLVKNRIEGMIYIKVFNMLVLLPLAAFFVPADYKFLFGVFPVYWVFQIIENSTQNLPIMGCAIIGFLFFVVLLIWATIKFIHKHFV